MRGADLGVQPHQVAHLLAGVGLHHLLRQLHRLGLAALQQRRRNEVAAIDQRVDAHHRLQRRDRQAVAEGDGDRVEFAPALRHDRLGAFGQLGAQPVELAELLQERLVRLDALRQRHARGADVGRKGEHLRQRDGAAHRMRVADVEAAVAQRAARIEHAC